MSKKGIILMLGAAIAAGFAGYKVGSKKGLLYGKEKISNIKKIPY